MEKNKKQLFIKKLERDLELQITALKEEKHVFDTLGGLKSLMKDASKKDEVGAILDKLQAFAEKKIVEEIEVYEEALFELHKIRVEKKDIETTIRKKYNGDVFIIYEKDSELFDRLKEQSDDIYYLIENLEFFQVDFVIADWWKI